MTEQEWNELNTNDFLISSYGTRCMITQKLENGYKVKFFKSNRIGIINLPYNWTKLTDLDKVKLL